MKNSKVKYFPTTPKYFNSIIRDIDTDTCSFDIDDAKVGNIRYRYFTIKESRNEYNRIFKYVLYRGCHRCAGSGNYVSQSFDFPK